VGESDDTNPSVPTFKPDEVTERDVGQRLKPTPVLRLDDGAWWEDD
jgi:hypothetical protein